MLMGIASLSLYIYLGLRGPQTECANAYLSIFLRIAEVSIS
jgi:hypothetical protein